MITKKLNHNKFTLLALLSQKFVFSSAVTGPIRYLIVYSSIVENITTARVIQRNNSFNIFLLGKPILEFTFF